MCLTLHLILASLVLTAWGAWMAVNGFRQKNRLMLISAAGAFTFLALGAAVMMVFITRPL